MNQVKRKKRKAQCGRKGLCCLRMLCQGMSDVGNSDISWSDGSGGSGKMCWLRKVCKSVSGNGYFNSGGGRMKKSWYDYLWIASLMYLVLGFFQILFAWLGLLCFLFR